MMDSNATKLMTSHNATFNIYEVIATRNVHLGENSVIKVMGMRFIAIKSFVRSKIDQIHIKYMPRMSKL